MAKIESAFEQPEPFSEGRKIKVSLVHGKAYCFGLQIDHVQDTIKNLGFKSFPFLPHQGRVQLKVSNCSFNLNLRIIAIYRCTLIDDISCSQIAHIFQTCETALSQV